VYQRRRLGAFALLAAVALTAACTGPRPVLGAVPATVTISYGHGQELDLDRPPVAGRHPVAVYVHGGGWTAGDRTHTAYLDDLRPGLQAAGLAVVTIDYRLAPVAPWPAQLDDLDAALRFLSAHSADYDLDMGKVILIGESAGAQVAAMAALRPERVLRPIALVDLFGPMDLTAPDALGAQTATIRDEVFGPAIRASGFALAVASPINYVISESPPTLVVHGDLDATVPLSQAERFLAKLGSVGVVHSSVIVHGGGHGLRSVDETPGPAEIAQEITTFIRARLKDS
jgi:acetyl esterase/lipase